MVRKHLWRFVCKLGSFCIIFFIIPAWRMGVQLLSGLIRVSLVIVLNMVFTLSVLFPQFVLSVITSIFNLIGIIQRYMLCVKGYIENIFRHWFTQIYTVLNLRGRTQAEDLGYIRPSLGRWVWGSTNTREKQVSARQGGACRSTVGCSIFIRLLVRRSFSEDGWFAWGEFHSSFAGLVQYLSFQRITSFRTFQPLGHLSRKQLRYLEYLVTAECD